MKKYLGIMALIVGLFSLTACQSQKLTAKAAYTKALVELKKDQTKKALATLNANASDAKTNGLKQNIKDLLATKQALDDQDLNKVKTNLDKLQQINEPQEVKKNVTNLTKQYQILSLAKTYYQEVKTYYIAKKYVAAGGSLQALMALNTKQKAVLNLQKKAQSYEKLIAQQQITPADKTATLIKNEYEKQTGQEITNASDEQVKKITQDLTNTQVITAFKQATVYPSETGDQYYVQKLSENQYQIEIRNTTQNEQVVNLKGMYKFNTQTKKAQKLNEITGQYVDIN